MLAVLVFLALGIPMFEIHFVFGQTNQAQSKIQAADTAVDQAFNVVLSAEKAGGNVTLLISQLNNATGLLTQAENAYVVGDNNTATTDASAVLPIARQVTTEAQAEKETALTSGQNSFQSLIIVTIVTLVLFILSLFLVWRLIKRSYFKSLSEAKPELNS